MADFPIEFGFTSYPSTSHVIQTSCTLRGDNVCVVYYTDTSTGYQYLQTYVLEPLNVSATYTCTCTRADGRQFTGSGGYYRTDDNSISTGTSISVDNRFSGAYVTGCHMITLSGSGSGNAASLQAAQDYFDSLVTYTIYWEYNGAQNTMEWRNATPGGVIFAFHRAQNDTYEFVLAYDLRSISNPEVAYMYMRRNDGGSSYVISTVYRYTDADVYTVSTNLTFYGSNNPSGWDVLLEGSHADYEYPSVIRAYWDAQGGVENLYVGVNGKAQQVKNIYVGVNGKAQQVKAIYVGVNGKARKVF